MSLSAAITSNMIGYKVGGANKEGYKGEKCFFKLKRGGMLHHLF
jgi:hypothetical protein